MAAMDPPPTFGKDLSDEHIEVASNEKGIVFDDGFVEDPAMTKRCLRKVDRRLIPMLAILYLMSYMDRSMIGNARIAGLQPDLQLSDAQFRMCLTVFFIPYALLEVPANIMLKLFKARVWLGCITLAWGTVMTLSGLVQNYAGLLAVRIMLGVTEAGFFPAAIFILTQWYAKHEIQTRMAYFYCAATFAGAFAGLFAYVLSLMDGIGGLEGWRWIFIVSGLMTVAIAATIPFTMVDGPESARYFTPEEKAYFLRRLEHLYKIGKDGSDGNQFKWLYLRQALTDVKIWLSMLIMWGNSIPGYALVLSLPLTINGLGYTAQQAQLLTIPVYTSALISILICSILADKYLIRLPFIVYPYMLSAAAFVILLALPADQWPGARYAILFFAAIGINTPVTGALSWNANNLAGSWKRSIGQALQMTITNLGGIVSSNIYIASEAPSYWTGYGVSLGITVTAIVAAYVLEGYLKRQNRKRDEMSEKEVRERWTEEELSEMGDQSPLVRYVL